MKISNLLWAGVLFLSLTPMAMQARTFTAADGRVLEGEIVEASEKTVTIRRSPDGRNFILPVSTLSAPDQEEIGKWRRVRNASKVSLSATKDRVKAAPKAKNNLSTTELEMWRWAITVKNTTNVPVEGLEIKYTQMVERKDRNQGPRRVVRNGGGTLPVPPIPPFGSVTVQTNGIPVQSFQQTNISTGSTAKGERTVRVDSTKWDEYLSGLGVQLSLGPDLIKSWKMGNDPTGKAMYPR